MKNGQKSWTCNSHLGHPNAQYMHEKDIDWPLLGSRKVYIKTQRSENSASMKMAKMRKTDITQC
jgi:hypothetical protein